MLRKIEFKIGYLEKAGLFSESSSGRSVFPRALVWIYVINGSQCSATAFHGSFDEKTVKETVSSHY